MYGGAQRRDLGKFVPHQTFGVVNEHAPLAFDHCRTVRIMGLDLGQAVDPAAASVLKYNEYDPSFVGPRYNFVECPALRVWPLGYDYMDLVEDVLRKNVDVLVVDYGGVGRVFVDRLYQRAGELQFRGKIKPIQSASSNAMVRIHTDMRRRQHITVPKVEIVTCLNILQQAKVDGEPRLRIGDMPEFARLKQELSDFQLLYTKAANMTFEHRGKGHHGDLAISLGLAAWYLQRPQRKLVVR